MATETDLFNYLLKWNSYFQKLSGKNQQRFLKRTISFLSNIRFESSEELALNIEMQALISSAFIQITFGLKKYHLNWFKTIFISHKAYKYQHVKDLYHGDTNPATKKINMVWPVIVKGFEIPDDALNLSIHELAHSLMLENIKSTFFNKFYSNRKWGRWKRLATKEMRSIKNGQNTFFRAYGGNNLMECFAVTTEAFFEQPIAYSKKHPLLYKAHCILLNQDPREHASPAIK